MFIYEGGKWLNETDNKRSRCNIYNTAKNLGKYGLTGERERIKDFKKMKTFKLDFDMKGKEYGIVNSYSCLWVSNVWLNQFNRRNEGGIDNVFTIEKLTQKKL